jgi:hypothetical protein
MDDAVPVGDLLRDEGPSGGPEGARSIRVARELIERAGDRGRLRFHHQPVVSRPDELEGLPAPVVTIIGRAAAIRPDVM